MTQNYDLVSGEILAGRLGGDDDLMVFRSRVFVFLLAGDVELLCEPNNLLLDEREIQSVFQQNILFPPDCIEKVSEIYL